MNNPRAQATAPVFWELLGPLGPERWHETDGAFDRVECAGETFSLPGMPPI